MARVSYLERDQAARRVQPIFTAMADYGPFMNQVRSLAHRPPILDHVMSMLFELRRDAVLPRRLVELAVVTVSKLNQCQYCIAHHGPVLEVEGLSQAGIDRLPNHVDHPELDQTERLVVEYAVQVTESPSRVSDSLFERLQARFTEPQIVELTWRIALCGAFNRVNDALQIEIEPEARAGLG